MDEGEGRKLLALALDRDIGDLVSFVARDPVSPIELAHPTPRPPP